MVASTDAFSKKYQQQRQARKPDDPREISVFLSEAICYFERQS